MILTLHPKLSHHLLSVLPGGEVQGIVVVEGGVARVQGGELELGVLEAGDVCGAHRGREDDDEEGRGEAVEDQHQETWSPPQVLVSP